MGKNGFLSPKAIANRIKAKGLQKLRWYCQMCNKQCRDENGFKCHKTSEAHQRQMALFIDNPMKFMNVYSEEFEEGFLQILKHKGGRRVKANVTYVEYIKDRNHIHMNATIWNTLTSFVMYLGRTGKAKVDKVDTALGPCWYLQYIDRDPAVVERQKKVDKMLRAEARLREKAQNAVQYQIERTKEAMVDLEEETVYTELKRSDPDEKVVFCMGSKKPPGMGLEKPRMDVAAMLKKSSPKKRERSDDETPDGAEGDAPRAAPKRFKSLDTKYLGNVPAAKIKRKKAKLSAMELIKQEIQQQKENEKKAREEQERREHEEMYGKVSTRYPNSSEKKKGREKEVFSDKWVRPGIVVKLVNERLQAKFNKKKGVVLDVDPDGFVAKIKLIKSGAVLKIDQEFLETVVPAFGRDVRVLNGRHVGVEGVLEALDHATFMAKIKIIKPVERQNDRVFVNVDHFSKIYKSKK